MILFGKKCRKLLLSVISVVAIVWLINVLIRKPQLDFAPEELRKYLIFSKTNKNVDRSSIDEVRRAVSRYNAEQLVRNTQRWGDPAPDTTTLLVHVHTDLASLQFLIISLAQVQSIDEALVIFSHSYYDDRINSLVQSVDFCRVLQIFYPNSHQLHPNKFSGIDGNDCRITTGNYFYNERKVWNALHKHHWWWKANWVFERLPWSPRYRGLVVFLEENDCLAPDFLYMLYKLKHVQSTCHFPGVEMLSLGGSYATRNYVDYGGSIQDLWSPLYERGLALNRTVWRSVAAIAKEYCTFDDCSWSSSLLNLLLKRTSGLPEILTVVAPRVFAVKGDRVKTVKDVWNYWKKANLFPIEVHAVFDFSKDKKNKSAVEAPKASGGWSNPRDYLMCLDNRIDINLTSESVTSSFISTV